MRWSWKPAQAEMENSKLSIMQSSEIKENSRVAADIHLDGAHRLLSYILQAARNKEEIILPDMRFYDGIYITSTENFGINHSRVADWLETIDRVKKERAETAKLTAQVENILENTYGLKPKAKKSAK